MITWKLFYADGSTVSSEHCEPAKVPGYGLICAMQLDRTPDPGNVGWFPVAGFDWVAYHLDERVWFGILGDSSMHDLLLCRQPIVGFCQCRRIPDAQFHALMAEARAWAEVQGWPRRTARRPVEVA